MSRPGKSLITVAQNVLVRMWKICGTAFVAVGIVYNVQVVPTAIGWNCEEGAKKDGLFVYTRTRCSDQLVIEDIRTTKYSR